MSSGVVRAQDASESFTLDLPYSANAATPAWLGHPVVGPAPFATLSLPITPPETSASLLVTVFFKEQAGGFLRVTWQSDALKPPPESGQTLPGPGEAALSSVLSDNFYEGIGMSNQRSLLVPADVMKQAGSLCFQASSANLGISRIEMEWLENSEGLSSPALKDTLVTPANGPTRPASELAGQPAQAQDPVWRNSIVDVPVTDVPLRIEQGLDFTVQVDSLPTLARIELKEAGLPWGQHLVVWVNNQRAGTIIPAAPSLENGGYGSAASDTYVGWREGTFLVPLQALRVGANALQFSAEPDVSSDATTDPNAPVAPLAVKDVVIQLAYPAATTATAAAASPISTPSTPTSSQPPSSDSGAPVPTTPPSPASATNR